MSETIDLERRHGATNYDPLPIVLTRGEGPWLWDTHGKRYVSGTGDPRVLELALLR